MLLQDLAKKGLINPEPFVLSNTMYLTVMGSHAYGCADTSVRNKMPDYDTYGFCIPPRGMLFPHSEGHIVCFGDKPGTYIRYGEPSVGFEQFHKTHVIDKDAHGGNGQEYDFTIFNIVKFFELCRQNNPNMLDSLFTRREHVLHCTQVGQMVRDARYDFLSKQVWKRFRGYAFSQLNKMTNKKAEGVRVEYIEKFGYDVKFAYNVIRLLDEAEQILLTGDLDLQRAKEAMKSVRRGEWTPEQVREFCMQKDAALEAEYVNCKLPSEPDEKKLGKLLMSCLEEHYGNLSNLITEPGWAEGTLREIDGFIQKVRSKLYS
jgi:predicted nucleotidyltransferase